MPSLPAVTSREVISALRRAGFEIVRQRGSHARLQHPDGRTTTVPVHSGVDIGRGLLRKILRDVELAPDEFVKLLK
jgi:predicted RNA binding protein YcfA (HicA-like mRNA interferase family)